MPKAIKPITNEAVEDIVIEESIKPKRKKTIKGVVYNCSLLNIRANASLSASIVGQLNVGELIDILDEKDNFYKIANGYVMKDYVSVN